MDAGFVHCDPHEGNMRLGKYVEFTFVGFGDSLGLSFRDIPRMLLDDGRLGLIDFGLVAQMTAVHQALGTSSHGGPRTRVQESMASAILSLLAEDYQALVPRPHLCHLCHVFSSLLKCAV